MDGRRDGRRERVRGEYRFSSLMKQNKKTKICLSFASPEKENYYFYIYDVITSLEKEKSPEHYYSPLLSSACDMGEAQLS